MTISLHKHLDSNTLHLPELDPMIGKDVRIIVVEESGAPSFRPDLTLLHELAGHIDLDFDAIEDLRSRSVE